LFVAILAVTAVAAFDKSFVELPQTPQEHKAAFDYLAAKHGRTYATDAERQRRIGVFAENLKVISAQRKKNPNAKFGPNLFFDVSEEEFKSYKMPKRNIVEESKKVHTIKTKSGGSMDVPSCLANGTDKKRAVTPANKKPSAYPATFDYRSHKPAVVTPVKNQAACGSCWAFSATEALESAWALKKGSLPVLAPQQIVDCSTACSIVENEETCDQGCDGGWPWAGIATLMQEGGQDSEASYPYQGVDGTCQFNPSNILAKAKNYTCISGPNLATDDEIMAAMMQYGPVSIAMDASPWQFYEFGIVDDTSGCSQTELDHAIQIVGWQDVNDVFFYPTPVWIVRNSWSSSWGYNGYIYIARGGNTCGIQASVTAVDV